MKLIHETYTCSKDHFRVEWGYTFKLLPDGETEPNDDALFDLVLGEEIADQKGFIQKVEKSWEDNKWAADAICAAWKEQP